MEKKLKVLIIEDRRENIIFLANNILKPKGFQIITAMDGESGLRKATEESPDLIVTDLKLPRMHGLEILANLQKRGSRIPSIVMTFHGSEETAIRAFRLGAKDYLIKPFKIDEVEKAIERAMEEIMLRQSAAGNVDNTLKLHAQSLEKKVAELEEKVRSNSNQKVPNTQASSSETVTTLKAQLSQMDEEVNRWKQRCFELDKLLSQQKTMTEEARESAKTLMRFIRTQQKKEQSSHQKKAINAKA